MHPPNTAGRANRADGSGRWPVAFLGLLGVAALVLLGLALPHPVESGAASPTPATAPEIDRSALLLVGGRLHRPGGERPFVGWMTETNRGGARISRSWVSNGVLDGLAEGYFPADGRLQVQEHFVAGVSHGPRRKWHASGVKQSEAEIVHGRIEGVFRRWHENGQLAQEIEMHGGVPDGVARAWSPDGASVAEVRMAGGRVVTGPSRRPGSPGPRME